MILITGGNTGIGFEVAKKLLSKGLSVCLGLRTTEKCELTRKRLSPFVADGRLELELLDLSDKNSVIVFAKTISEKDWKIDALVHNGAALFSNPIESKYPGIEMTLATNHLGAFLLTHEMLRLDCFNSQSARVIIVSSSLHDPDRKGTGKPPDFDLENLNGSRKYDKMLFYKTSKLCNLWFLYQLCKKLPKHITANALSPGFIPGTDLGRDSGFVGNIVMKWVLPWFPFTKSLDHGAETYIQLILDPAFSKVSGKYFEDFKETKSSVDSHDEAKQQLCWDWSSTATGIIDFGK